MGPCVGSIGIFMDKIINELGIIVVVLIAAVIVDSWYLERVYHYSSAADPLGLLRDVPDYLSRNKSIETKINGFRLNFIMNLSISERLNNARHTFW